MKPWSEDAKIKLVQFYFETKSVTLTQRKFRKHFKTQKAPSRNVILQIVNKFLARGNVSNNFKGHSGRKRSQRTTVNVARVRAALQRSPNKSMRRLSQEIGCSRATAQRIARVDAELFPYKVSVHQTLTEGQKTARKRFCAWFVRKCELNHAFVNQIWFSDEAHFHLDGKVNSQNYRFWSHEKPDVLEEAPLHSAKITVWCAMSSAGIVGPFFFEDGGGDTQTVNAERYRAVLAKFWRSLNNKLRSDPDALQQQWFQQDGATAHTAQATRDWLRERFGGRLISRLEVCPWPASSPDLTPLDFFLWGHLKSQVYRTNPRNLQDLKDAVKSAVRRVSPSVCHAAAEGVLRRAKLCLERNGGHFEHVL